MNNNNLRANITHHATSLNGAIATLFERSILFATLVAWAPIVVMRRFAYAG